MDAAELARWTRFAAKGGIGKCTARIDCIAEETGDLMFLQDDEITVLMQLTEESLFLGYCEGVVGRFHGNHVVFHSKLKKPIIAKRSSSSVPRRESPSAARSESSSPHPVSFSSSPREWAALSQRSSSQRSPASQLSPSSAPLIDSYFMSQNSSPSASYLETSSSAARDSATLSHSPVPVMPLNIEQKRVKGARASPTVEQIIEPVHSQVKPPPEDNEHPDTVSAPVSNAHPGPSSSSSAHNGSSSHALPPLISFSSPSTSSTADSAPYTPPDSRTFQNEKQESVTSSVKYTQDPFRSHDISYTDTSYTDPSTRISFGLSDAQTGIGLSLLGNLGDSGDVYKQNYGLGDDEEDEEEATLGYADEHDDDTDERQDMKDPESQDRMEVNSGVGSTEQPATREWEGSALPSPYDRATTTNQPSSSSPKDEQLHENETILPSPYDYGLQGHNLPSTYDSSSQGARSSPEKQTTDETRLPSPYDHTPASVSDHLPSPYDAPVHSQVPVSNPLPSPYDISSHHQVDFPFPRPNDLPSHDLPSPHEQPSSSLHDPPEQPTLPKTTSESTHKDAIMESHPGDEDDLEGEEEDWNIYDDYRYSRFSMASPGARYSRYSRFSMVPGAGTRNSQSSGSLLAGKGKDQIPPMPISPTARETEASSPAPRTTPSTGALNSMPASGPPTQHAYARAASSASTHSLYSAISETQTIESQTQSVYSHSSLLSMQFPGVPGSERPPHLTPSGSSHDVGQAMDVLSIDAALAPATSSPPLSSTSSVPNGQDRPATLTIASPLLHTTFGSPLSSPVGDSIRGSGISSGVSSSMRSSGMSSSRASGSTGVNSTRVSTASHGTGAAVSSMNTSGKGNGMSAGAGIASALRMRLENERERDGTIQMGIEHPRGPEKGRGTEDTLMRPIVVEDDEDNNVGLDHQEEDQDEDTPRILTDSPMPLDEDESVSMVEGPSLASASVYSGETAETLSSDVTSTPALQAQSGGSVPDALRPRQASGLSSWQPSPSILRSASQSPSVPLPQSPSFPSPLSRAPTQAHPQSRTSLFLPHPNAPKAPPLMQGQGPMYARAEAGPYASSLGHVGAKIPPGSRFIHGTPPPGPNVHRNQSMQAGAGTTPYSVHILRQIIGWLRAQGQAQGRMGLMTLYARCEPDLASAIGPVPIVFSVEPIPGGGVGMGGGASVNGAMGIGMGGSGSSGVGSNKGLEGISPANGGAMRTDAENTPPLRIRRAMTTAGTSDSAQTFEVPSDELKRDDGSNKGKYGSMITGMHEVSVPGGNGTLTSSNMGMSGNNGSNGALQRTGFVPQAGAARPRSRSFSGFNTTAAQEAERSREDPQQISRTVSASAVTSSGLSSVVAPLRISSKPSPLSLVRNNDTAPTRPSPRSPTSPLSQVSPITDVTQFASFSSPPVSGGQADARRGTPISPPPVSPHVPTMGDRDISPPMPLSPMPPGPRAPTASVRSSSVSSNHRSIISPQPWVSQRSGSLDGESSQSETRSLMTSPPPIEPSARSSPLTHELSLRTKMSLPMLRGKKSTRLGRADETASVTSSNGRTEEHETVQVQDMDFELIKPTLPLSGRTSQDSVMIGRDMLSDHKPDSSSPFGDTSSILSGAMPPRSPLAPVDPSIPDVKPSRSTDAHSSMDAHRHRELKWMALLPTTPPAQARKSKKVRRLLIEGVPSSVRYLVWCHLTDSKARALPNVYSQLGKRGRVPVFNEIERDAQRLFPDQAQLHNAKGPLVSLLQAYLSMVPDIQYSSGLTSIAGHLLLLAPEEDAFWIFVSMMDTHLRSYFSANPIQMEVDSALFSKALESTDAAVGKKLFVTLGISPSSICRPWFSTLFVGTLPVDYLHRVWDMFLYDGVTFLFRVAMVLIQCCRHLLLQSTSEASALEHLSRPPLACLPSNADAFLALTMSMKLKDDDVRKQRIKMEAQVKRHTQTRASSASGSGVQTTSISLPKN